MNDFEISQWPRTVDDAYEIIIKAFWERLRVLPSLDTEAISSN